MKIEGIIIGKTYLINDYTRPYDCMECTVKGIRGNEVSVTAQGLFAGYLPVSKIEER